MKATVPTGAQRSGCLRVCLGMECTLVPPADNAGQGLGVAVSLFLSPFLQFLSVSLNGRLSQDPGMTSIIKGMQVGSRLRGI